MIYNANNQNDPGRWGPSHSESVDTKTALKTYKKPLLIIGAVVLVVLSALFWTGLFVSMSDSGSSSISNRPVAEQEYLDLLYEAHREDGDRSHTFANDSEAVAHGYTVCELLDTYYIEDIADALAVNREGILRGVSLESKAYGIAAASIKLCPEHLPEVRNWVN